VESPGVFVEETTSEGNRKQVEYNWELEWYPMYLTDEMPKSTPLGLTVFDRSLVLFYDGNGDLNCFEDRCPHRLARSRTLPLEDTLCTSIVMKQIQLLQQYVIEEFIHSIVVVEIHNIAQ
jgi:hypothetical protein